MSDDGQKCFVLMPFETRREKYYAQIFSRAIDDAGLVPKRGDSLFRSSPIMGDIWKFVQESTVLLADLTGRNANVFYELGLAHAIGKPVVLVAETMDDVPFDLRGLRVLTFDRDDPDWGATLRERIASALKETLADVLGAVPSMFIQRSATSLSPPKQTPLESEVRSLAEEITALRREVGTPRPKRIVDPRDHVVSVGVTFKQPAGPAEIERIGSLLKARAQSTNPGRTTADFEIYRRIDRVEQQYLVDTILAEKNAVNVQFHST